MIERLQVVPVWAARAQMLRSPPRARRVDQVVSDCEVGAGCARANAAITVIKTVKMKSFISMSAWSHAT
jgi:hypothetical protein